MKTAIGAEDLDVISSYQTLSADKKSKSYLPRTKLVKKAGAYMPQERLSF
jgi:hypothetical protein